MKRLERLPQTLPHLRATRGLKRSDLSRLAGVSQTQLASYEDGSSSPRLDTLDRILDALEVTDAELLFVLGRDDTAERRAPSVRIPPTATLGPEAQLHLADALYHLGRFMQAAGLELVPRADSSPHREPPPSPEDSP